MKKHFFYIPMLLLGLFMYAQPGTYKYDFGQGAAKSGYAKVTPASVYTDQAGFGFDFGSKVEAAGKGGKLNGDYITGKQVFYFSVKVPEGNYDVKILFGDMKGTSATTVRTECRRLMLENITTKKGETAERTFTVHIKDSLIRDANGNVVDKIRLKPRERQLLQFDNKLTLEFNDSLPKICAVEIIPNKSATTIFLAGDSTVTDQPEDPYASWGQMFPVFLNPGTVAVANYAESGETMLAFEAQKRLDKVWSMAKPGDYLLIEFTHNDQKAGGNHLDAMTTFKDKIKSWIAQAKEHKMIPVLVTSTHRRKFDAEGHIENTLLEYPEAMRQVAQEEKVALIDLNAMTKVFYETLGDEASKKALVHFPANTFPRQTKALEDNTHFSTYGAYELAKCVVSSIQKQNLPLAKFVKKSVKPYDPAKPMAFADFYWPMSAFTNLHKPDGN